MLIITKCPSIFHASQKFLYRYFEWNSQKKTTCGSGWVLIRINKKYFYRFPKPLYSYSFGSCNKFQKFQKFQISVRSTPNSLLLKFSKNISNPRIASSSCWSKFDPFFPVLTNLIIWQTFSSFTLGFSSVKYHEKQHGYFNDFGQIKKIPLRNCSIAAYFEMIQNALTNNSMFVSIIEVLSPDSNCLLLYNNSPSNWFKWIGTSDEC